MSMSVKEIFETMAYGPAPENAQEAREWLAQADGRFGHFINGSFTAPRDDLTTANPATGEALASFAQADEAEVNAAISAAQAAQSKWQKIGGPQRARHLYALARHLQKHARMLAVLETLDTGKPIRESRDIDIPLAQRHFYYHAGMAQLMEQTLPDREALGVCGQIIPWNFPLLMLAWKIAPALAAGNTVVLKPAEYTPLTALFFAQICADVGLPDGVVNIITGDGRTGALLAAHKGLNKIAFTGSTAVGRQIREASAGNDAKLTLELGGKSAYIVFDDADLDSAVEGLVDAIWFNQGQVCCAGSRLLVQEGVAEAFHERLRGRMERLRIGDPLDKCVDIGALVDPVQHKRISAMVEECTEGERFQPSQPMPQQGCFYPPTLITGLSPAHRLMQEEIFGPVLVSCTFRTPGEAVELANNTRYGLAASVWSENINLALDVAPKLHAGVVWVNAGNLFDAAAPFGGVRESGFGREGGWAGMQAYTRSTSRWNTTKPAQPNTPAKNAAQENTIDRTAKLYIGGKQSRPDGGYSQPVFTRNGKLLSHVPVANRKDVRNAVEAAHKAAGWAKLSGHQRAQILYFMAENLEARASEMAERLDSLQKGKTGKQEVEAAVCRLFSYGAWADKFEGSLAGVPARGAALVGRKPVGVIAAFCPDEAPLLGMISLLAPAMAMGNRMVLVASQSCPLPALEFAQVLETSDVPGGVANLLTGDHTELAPVLAKHLDLDAVWDFSPHAITPTLETGSTGNLKRTWCHNATAPDWLSPDAEGTPFLEAATEVQTVWIPFGE